MYVWPEKRDQNQMKMKPFDQLTMVGFPGAGWSKWGGIEGEAPAEKCARAFVRHAHRGVGKKGTSRSMGDKPSTKRFLVLKGSSSLSYLT